MLNDSQAKVSRNIKVLIRSILAHDTELGRPPTYSDKDFEYIVLLFHNAVKDRMYRIVEDEDLSSFDKQNYKTALNAALKNLLKIYANYDVKGL